MRLTATLALALLASAGQVVAQEETPEVAAQRAAEAWVVLVDSGNYAESWTEAATAFREAVPQATWVQQMESVRPPLGAVTTRELLGAQHTTSLPNAPPGEYVIVQFHTKFAGRETAAVETVVPMKDGETWKVSGYWIQ